VNEKTSITSFTWSYFIAHTGVHFPCSTSRKQRPLLATLLQVMLAYFSYPLFCIHFYPEIHFRTIWYYKEGFELLFRSFLMCSAWLIGSTCQALIFPLSFRSMSGDSILVAILQIKKMYIPSLDYSVASYSIWVRAYVCEESVNQLSTFLKI